MGERAVQYRRINRLPDDWGTAVNVQQMVYGNKGERVVLRSGLQPRRGDRRARRRRATSCRTPRARTSSPACGRRATSPSCATGCPTVADQLTRDPAQARAPLQGHAGHRVHGRGGAPVHAPDAQRQAAGAGRGALRGRRVRGAAADARPRRSRRSTPARSTRSCTRRSTRRRATRCSPTASPPRRARPRARSCSPPPRRSSRRRTATAVILVRPFTEADDVAGFHAAVGILTSEGGKASHAALVARGMGRPAVTGAAELDIDLQAGRGADRRASSCTRATSSRSTARPASITTDDVPLVEAHIDARFETVLRWSDELRQIGVRANADTPEDAARAHRFGAEGIGLCRTEHMFMAADRQPKMRAMIMADDEAGRRAALDELLPLQQSDFEGLFEAMVGLAGDDPPARPAAARVPARPLRAARGDRARADRPQPATRRARAPVRAGRARSRRPTRCSGRAACGSA